MGLKLAKHLRHGHNTWPADLYVLQGVRGQSGFFNWALRERNIQVRLYLKIVLKS